MSSIADRLDNMTVKVLSPDKNIQAIITQRSTISVIFRSGTFDSYSKEGLEHQLERLGWLAWSGFSKGYDAAIGRETSPEARRRAGYDIDPAMRRFYDDVGQIQVRAKSSKDAVRMQTIGMQSWKVRLHEGKLAEMDDTQFAAEVAGAANDLVQQYLGEIALLKHKHFVYSFVKGRR